MIAYTMFAVYDAPYPFLNQFNWNYTFLATSKHSCLAQFDERFPNFSRNEYDARPIHIRRIP